MSYELHHGDCIEVMASMPPESIDAIVTSPPYAEQRRSTYGGIPEAEYPAWTVAWMTEAWRVLKPNGSVLINIRPHIKNGQISDYTLRTRLALRDAGWNEVDELIWHKTGAMPTGSRHKPRRSWESIHWFAKHGQPYSDAKANGWPTKRKTGLDLYGQHTRRDDWTHYDSGNPASTPMVTRCSDVISMAKGNASTGHPAPYPVPLAEWMGRLVCPPGGTILDPFSGSASTGVAAVRNGWTYIGIDAVEEYVEMSSARLDLEFLKLGDAA
jgi:site-specific DNA-methyltransferase (adenine-specific)